MAYKIEWTPEAKSELLDLLKFWTEHNQSKTYSIYLNSLIKKQLNIIAHRPKIGKLSDYENVRKWIVRDYSIYYIIQESKIVILKIWDDRRNPMSVIL